MKTVKKWLLLDIGIMFLLFVLNIILKAIFIDSPDIGGDEPFTIFYARNDISMFWDILEHENNPPLYTLLLKGVLSLFGGNGPTTYRALSLLFSALIAPILYAFGKRFFNWRIGLTTALIFSFTSYHMFFAHEARPYSMFALFTVLSMYSYFNLTVKNRTNSSWWLILWNVILIYTHFFGFFVLFIQFISSIGIREIRSNHLKRLFIGWGITFICFLPYLPTLLHRFSDSSGGTWVGEPTFTELYNNLWRFSNEPVNTALFLLILILGIVFYFIRRSKMKLEPKVKIVILWFVLPYLLMFGLSFILPMFLDRYLVYISIGFYLSITLALQTIFKKEWIQLVASGLIILMMILTCNYKAGNPRPDKATISNLREIQGDDMILIAPDWYDLHFAIHFDNELFETCPDVRKCLNTNNIYPIQSLSNDLKADIQQQSKVYFYDSWSQLVDPEGKIRSFLENNFSEQHEMQGHEGLRITVFQK